MLGRATRTPAITRLPIIKRNETSKTKRGYAMLGTQTAYPLTYAAAMRRADGKEAATIGGRRPR